MCEVFKLHTEEVRLLFYDKDELYCSCSGTLKALFGSLDCFVAVGVENGILEEVHHSSRI